MCVREREKGKSRTGNKVSINLRTLYKSSVCVCMLSRFSRAQPCGTAWTAAHQAPLFIGLSKQEQWSGLPFPSLQIISNIFN